MLRGGHERTIVALATQLRRFRLAAGFSQAELAERADLSIEAVSALERGTRRRPHPQTVRALASALALTAADRTVLFEAAAGQLMDAPARCPRELPQAPGDFTGRIEDMATLRELLGFASADSTSAERASQVVIGAIDGMGGVGKSALAIKVAHELADAGAFADGQLYVNLHGATPGVSPLEPLAAIGRMLRSLGLDPAAIPGEVEEAAARFRSLAAGRRMLVLLDNARNSEQVRSLLPGSPGCAVVVTSRQVLGTLEGARTLHLDVLPRGQALELLGRIAGRERVAAELPAAVEVIDRCGRLPLAIRVAGARLTARSSWRIRELADRLTDATHRLEELRSGELAVQATFDISLRALERSPDPVDQAAAEAFGLLSLPDGPDISVVAGARLLDQTETAAGALLERLVDAQLLQIPRPGRYEFHDLVRVYARNRTLHLLPDCERRTALVRVAGFYTATAWRTVALLRPGTSRLVTADQRWMRGGLKLADASAALTWAEAERLNMVAAITQMATAVRDGAPEIPTELPGQLAKALYCFFEVRSYWNDWRQSSGLALDLARRAGDRAAQASAHNDLGQVYARLGRYAESVVHHTEGLALFRELDNRNGQAHSLNNLGFVYGRSGRRTEAIAALEEGVRFHRELGDAHGLAHSLSNLGFLYGRLGRSDEGIAHNQEALAIFRLLGDEQGQARSLGNLGLAHARLGRHTEAIAHHEEALELFCLLGDRQGQAHTLDNLGYVHGRLGRYAAAISRHREGLTVFRELGDRQGQADTLNNLGFACGRLGRGTEAVAHHRESLSLFLELGYRQGQARSLTHLGIALGLSGSAEEAIECLSKSLAIARELGYQPGVVRALRDIGDALQAAGREEQARTVWQEGAMLAGELDLPESYEVQARIAALAQPATSAQGEERRRQ